MDDADNGNPLGRRRTMARGHQPGHRPIPGSGQDWLYDGVGRWDDDLDLPLPAAPWREV